MYPIICLIEKENNDKFFIIPGKESLLEFSGMNKQSLELGVNIFKSLMPENLKEEITPSYLQLNEVSLCSIEVSDLGLGLKDFEKRTLLNASQYTVYFLMNSEKIENIEERDWSAINSIVSLEREDDSIKKPKLH